MTNAGTTRRPREAPVGYERDALAKAHALDGGGGIEHLTHTGAALGALVADHDDVARPDLTRVDGALGILLALEDASGTLVDEHLRGHGGTLDDRSLGGEVAAQHRNAPRRREGIVDGTDDGAVADAGAGDVLAHGPARDGHALAVDETRLVELGHDGGDAPRPVEVLHVGGAGRRQVAEVGGPLAHGVCGGQIQLDATLARDGRQVEHRVGGAAERHVHGKGVSEGLWAHDVTGGDAPLEHVHDGHAGVLGELQAAGVHGRHGPVAGKAHADDLGQAVHGVGGIHARAGAAARTDVSLELVELGLVYLAGRVGAHGLEHGREARLVPVDVAGKHRPARDEGRGQVKAGGGHEQAGHVLVAVGDHDQRVKAMRERHALGGVGDEVAGHERVPHAGVTHGDAVANGDGGKDHGHATGHGDAHLDGIGYLIDVDVAGHDLIEGAHDAHERARDLLVGPTERVVEGAVRRRLGSKLDRIAPHVLLLLARVAILS